MCSSFPQSRDACGLKSSKYNSMFVLGVFAHIRREAEKGAVWVVGCVWGWAGTYHHHALNFGGGLGGVCGCVGLYGKASLCVQVDISPFPIHIKRSASFVCCARTVPTCQQRVYDDHQATGERQHWIDCGLIWKHAHSNNCQFVPPIIPPKTRQTTTTSNNNNNNKQQAAPEMPRRGKVPTTQEVYQFVALVSCNEQTAIEWLSNTPDIGTGERERGRER